MGKRQEHQDRKTQEKSNKKMEALLAFQRKKNHPYTDFPSLGNDKLLEIAYQIKDSVCQRMARSGQKEGSLTVPRGLAKRTRHLKAEMRRRYMDTEIGEIFGTSLTPVEKQSSYFSAWDE